MSEKRLNRRVAHITEDMNPADRVASEDVSKLSDDELAHVLKEGIKVDLSKPPFWEEGDVEL